MLESQKEQIAQVLASYLKEHKPNGMSQKKISLLSGVSEGYLSQIVNRNWNTVPVKDGKSIAIGDTHFRKLQAFLGISLEVFPTRNYIDVMIALDDAKRHTSEEALAYRLIDGDTGAGKTFAIAEFQRLNPSSTYVVKCANSMTARNMVKRMAEVVGVPSIGDNETIIKAVADKMNREGNAIMIFDEAETMVKKGLAFGIIKDLYDAVHELSAVVIIGANGILDKLKVKASYNVESFPQVLRRFGATPVMLSSGIDLGDATDICMAYGITAKRDVNALVAACENYGTFFAKLKKMKADQEVVAETA